MGTLENEQAVKFEFLGMHKNHIQPIINSPGSDIIGKFEISLLKNFEILVLSLVNRFDSASYKIIIC